MNKWEVIVLTVMLIWWLIVGISCYSRLLKNVVDCRRNDIGEAELGLETNPVPEGQYRPT